MEYSKIAKNTAKGTGKGTWIVLKETLLSLFYCFNPVGKLNRKYFILTNIVCFLTLGLGYLYFPLLGNVFPQLVDQVYLYSFLAFMGINFLNLQRKRLRDADGSWWLLFLQFVPTHSFLVWFTLLFAESQEQHPKPIADYKVIGYTHPINFWMRTYTFLLAWGILLVALSLEDFALPAYFDFYQQFIVNNAQVQYILNEIVTLVGMTPSSFLNIKIVFFVISFLGLNVGIFLLGLFVQLTLRPPLKVDYYPRDVENKTEIQENTL